MNSLYKLPLHGVACAPFCDAKRHNTLHKLNLSFEPLLKSPFNNDLNNNANWVMSDQGERYKTEVSLFINKLSESSEVTNSCEVTNSENSLSKNSLLQKQYILQIDCQGKGQFHITNNTVKVYWDEQGTDSAHYFQTIGLALWLELNKVLCIHANALAYKGDAIALVAPSRTGKTTLTAELCKADFELMTDDMMALHHIDNQYMVYPSWPEARMWPETLELIQSKNSNSKDITLTKVHEQFEKRTVKINKNNGFGFCETPKPLKTIYLLNRVNTKEELQRDIDKSTANQCELTERKVQQTNTDSNVCNITTLTSAHAVILLLQNSILGSAYSVLDLEVDRVKSLTKLIKNVSFKKITYVSGKQNLVCVKCELIKGLNNNDVILTKNNK